jgi:hypothetical protein
VRSVTADHLRTRTGVPGDDLRAQRSDKYPCR